MSRFYDIRILEPNGGKLIKQYTSLAPGGWTIPGALNVELDIPTFAMASPAGAAFARVWGIGIQDINQAFDLNGKTVQIYGGMARGLPLANPAQAGLLLEGEITQAFGNWQGVNQTLDLIVQSGVGSASAPANIVLNWLANRPLAETLRATLLSAFPDHTVTINISPNLVQTHDEPAVFQTAVQLAQWVKAKTQNLVGGTYQGVDFLIRQKAFFVYDGSSPTKPRAIAFNDLIGQPSWIGPDTIQFKCAMRADINVADYVSLPKGQITTTAQSYSQFRNKSNFTGSYQIIQARAVGAYRQPDANAWVSVFDAFPIVGVPANG